MKVSELKGELLDYWVARALGYASRDDVPSSLTGEWAENGFKNEWQPSIDWAQGGPFIERERIELECNSEGMWYAKRLEDEYMRHEEGATPLIAAMRAYVASKFGEEVPGSAD
ncbi:phage protein NinX family protein [Paraburkholderia caffeinilytica]|uniref:phage protein NinX family protein n=1 Tax=Paraburkholderia caffeinilytica TaxID=1761016 RepID=UPI0038BC5B75